MHACLPCSWPFVLIGVAGFNKDPFTEFAQPEAHFRHSFGHYWFRAILESPGHDVLVQEWVEMEKVVGVLVMQTRRVSTEREAGVLD